MTVLLFCGDAYYPGGGWRDFDSEHSTVEEAKAHIDAQVRVEHVPAWTEHVPARDPNGPVLWTSTNSFANPPRTDAHDVHHRAYDEVHAPFDWAHIVEDGEVVASWHRGGYGVPSARWIDGE